MNPSRREFVAKTIHCASGVGLVAALENPALAAPPAGAGDEGVFFKVFPIGRVEKDGKAAHIRVFDAYVDALLGLAEWSHVNVFYWFDKNDTPQKRRILQVHPRGDSKNPLTGVFACRAPVRPNLIALSACRVLSVKGNLVAVDEINAFDATPVLDLKPFNPSDAPTEDVRVPSWAGGKGRR